jgi:pyruvate kinase
MAGRPVALLADLAGPKVRLGALEGGSARLEVGQPFVLAVDLDARAGPGSAARASVTYDGLTRDVRPGDTILLGDGVAELRVEAVGEDEVVTAVVRGGTIRSRTGVAIPSDRLSLNGLTEQDHLDALAAIDLGADYVAQSFVRSAEDVHALRSVLGAEGPPIVAKIETRPAVDRFDDILPLVGAVMIARGDLGVELPYEEVPIVQKQLVARALERGVPTIVATQMLESMVSAPRPTRAEASDVANAVFEGADAIMLSAETAIGRFPVLAAEAAVRIIERCEAEGGAYVARPTAGAVVPGTDGIVVAAVALADADPSVDAIGCFTRTGRTARLLAALRPTVPIIAFTSDRAVGARLALVHGVLPFDVPLPGPDDAGQPLEFVVRQLRATGAMPPGSDAVLVASTDVPGSGPTLLELRKLSAS